MNKKTFIIGIIVFVICALAFVLRLFPLQVSHWWDEAVYLQNAEVISSGRTNYDEFILRPPMLSILFAGGFLFNHSVLTASVLVALLGTLGVLFMYFLGKELYNETVGVLAALFLAIAPFFVMASHWIMTDMPSLTFIIIAFYLLLIAANRNSNPSYFFSGVFFATAILTRFTSLILLFVVPTYFLIMKIPWKKLLPLSIGGAVLALPYLIWAQLRYGFFLVPFIRANSAVSDSVGNIFYYLLHFLEVYPLFVIAGFVLYLVTLLIVFRPFAKCEKSELLLGIRTKINSSLRKNLGSIDGVLLIWILLFFAYISITPHKEPRYILPLAIPFVLLSAKGYSELLQRGKWLKYGAILLLLVLIAPAAQESFTHLQPPYFNSQVTEPVSISNYLVSLNQPTAIVYANHDYPVYAYYTAMPTIVVPGDDSFYTQFPNSMKQKGYFIFYNDVPKQPTQEWLDSHFQFKKIKEGQEIIVYEYTP